MAFFDNNNFDDIINSTKKFAKAIGKKSSEYLDESKKKVEYLDAKNKLNKLYAKFGEMNYLKYIGDNISDEVIDVVANEIADCKANLVVLKENISNTADYQTAVEIKKEAQQLKNSVKDVSNETKEAILGQLSDLEETVKNIKKQYDDAQETIDSVKDEVNLQQKSSVNYIPINDFSNDNK